MSFASLPPPPLFSPIHGSPNSSSSPGNSREPSPRQKKWEYLHSLEEHPRMSRWEYLNSLNQEACEPEVAEINHGDADFVDESFYDEPEHRTHEKGSCLANCRSTVCTPRARSIALLTIMVATIVTAIVLSVQPKSASSTSVAPVVVGVSSLLYHFNEEISLEVVTSQPKSSYWLGVWQAEHAPGSMFSVSDTPPAMWMNMCDGGDDSCATQTILVFSENTDWQTDYVLNWPLCNGRWLACVIDDATSSKLACSDVFVVSGGTCDGVCKPATGDLAKAEHLNPTPMSELSRIAFGSSFEPRTQVDGRLWDHVRNVFQADLWVWLGVNDDADGEDVELKRIAYNLNKEDPFYSSVGPLGEPKIPVTGTWDDHDAGTDNSGAEYQCHKLAQNEFAYWFDLPIQDPRHPAQGNRQQKGVYSSVMFSKPGEADVNGVHLILLDVRYHRSPTFEENGPCLGGNSTILGGEQWAWLEHELRITSKVKVIGTAMQVMQPTDQVFTDVSSYCANDGTSFADAVAELGETERDLGTKYESWSQIPQEKLKLLRLLQRTISNGFAEKIIIISGEMHWGEMMAKKMPAAAGVGESQVIYEITASGIDTNFPYADPNANRLKVRSADNAGDGVYQHECKFPFKYEGVEHNDCFKGIEDRPWCATLVDSNNNYKSGDWGYCMPEEDEPLPRSNITTSGENSCYENLHVCKAQANYGGIEIDWNNSVIQLYLFTPHAANPVAGKVTIGL